MGSRNARSIAAPAARQAATTRDCCSSGGALASWPWYLRRLAQLVRCGARHPGVPGPAAPDYGGLAWSGLATLHSFGGQRWDHLSAGDAVLARRARSALYGSGHVQLAVPPSPPAALPTAAAHVGCAQRSFICLTHFYKEVLFSMRCFAALSPCVCHSRKGGEGHETKQKQRQRRGGPAASSACTSPMLFASIAQCNSV